MGQNKCTESRGDKYKDLKIVRGRIFRTGWGWSTLMLLSSMMSFSTMGIMSASVAAAFLLSRLFFLDSNLSSILSEGNKSFDSEIALSQRMPKFSIWVG
jgi:hypothetical protein